MGCESVSLGLEFLFANVESLKVLKLLFDLNDLLVLILVVLDHLVNCNLVLRDQHLALVSLGFSLTTVSLILKGHIDHVFFL